MGVSVCWLAQQGAHINTNMGDNPEIWKAAAMQDHFEKIQKLPDKVDGVPNFRRVPGYKVYCCGQPTIEGFTNALNKACEGKKTTLTELFGKSSSDFSVLSSGIDFL